MPKAPLTQPEPAKSRTRLADNCTTFILSFLKKRKVRDEIQTLLDEAKRLKPTIDAAEARLKEIRMKLFEYAVDNDTNGFRDDRIAFQFTGMRSKETLSTTKLLEAGVGLEVINAAYVKSEEWPDCKFVMFDEPKKAV